MAYDICELLLAKSGLGVISSLCVTDIDFIIDYLCVSYARSLYFYFYFKIFYVYFCTTFIINKYAAITQRKKGISVR